MARWQNGYAAPLKSSICRFNSGSGLSTEEGSLFARGPFSLGQANEPDRVESLVIQVAEQRNSCEFSGVFRESC